MSSFSNKKVIPGYRFTCGITFFYLSLILLIPLAAFVLYTAGMGWEKFLAVVLDYRVFHAYYISLLTALATAVFTLLKWQVRATGSKVCGSARIMILPKLQNGQSV